MNTRRAAVFFVCAVITLTGCTGNAATPVEVPAEVPKEAVQGNNDFAFDLYDRLREKDGNIFFSPYSISTALAMTYAGARGNTAKQMAEVLHLDQDQDKVNGSFKALVDGMNRLGKEGSAELYVANALWPQKGYTFLNAYINTVKMNYGAMLKELDYAKETEKSRQIINAWVEDKTKEKIKELLKPGIIRADTRLVLTNAIYFKGKWEEEFSEDKTKPDDFTLDTGGTVQAPMMNQTEKFKYGETGDVQILEMPYVNEELSMLVFLPKEKDGIGRLEEEFTPENVIEWTRVMSRQKVVVSFPKFKVTRDFSLAGTLYNMGMTDAFAGGKADFSGMTGYRDLYISAVEHKAFVDVNEEGTEAAAATAVVMLKAAAMPSKPPVVFRADHPFIFVIRENSTGSILFIGRITDPSAD